MTLGDILESLANTELRDLGMVLEGQTIAPDYRAQVIGYVNKALTRLYSRFTHEVDFLDLELDGSIQRYWINPLHAVSDATPGNTRTRYIIDSVDEPFDGGLIKVLAVRELDSDDPEKDEDLLINERTPGIDRVKTMAYDKLWVRTPEPFRMLQIEYQKNHPKIAPDATDDEPVSVYPLLEEALTMHIAGRVYSGMGGEENLTRGQLYFKEYERLCQIAKTEDLLQLTSSDRTSKLVDRGFV